MDSIFLFLNTINRLQFHSPAFLLQHMGRQWAFGRWQGLTSFCLSHFSSLENQPFQSWISERTGYSQHSERNTMDLGNRHDQPTDLLPNDAQQRHPLHRPQQNWLYTDKIQSRTARQCKTPANRNGKNQINIIKLLPTSRKQFLFLIFISLT